MTIPRGFHTPGVFAILKRRFFRNISLTDRCVLGRSGHIISAEFDGSGAVLFHTGDRTAHLLNVTAWDVYRLINGRRSIGEIGKLLSDEYGVGEKKVEKDVKKVCCSFLERGILTRGE
jgi:hypothetical protein